jgi:hypothetical protein
VTADTVIDQLFGLPPEEFVPARDLAVRDLRAGGERAEAARVKGLRRPTAAAAAVNRLVREHRSDVRHFLSAAEALRKAQLAGRSADEETRREREALDTLVRAGGHQVRQSLQAAAVDGEAARQLLEARLERELEPRGFGTLLDHAPKGPGRARKAPTQPATRKRDDRPARARLERARQALADVQAREREAEHAWQRAQAELRKAEQAVAKAERDLANLGG